MPTQRIKKLKQHHNLEYSIMADKTQQYIIRQSSLQRAVEFYAANNLQPSLTDVVLAADVLSEWVETRDIKRARDFDGHYLLDSLIDKRR